MKMKRVDRLEVPTGTYQVTFKREGQSVNVSMRRIDCRCVMPDVEFAVIYDPDSENPGIVVTKPVGAQVVAALAQYVLAGGASMNKQWEMEVDNGK